MLTYLKGVILAVSYFEHRLELADGHSLLIVEWLTFIDLAMSINVSPASRLAIAWLIGTASASAFVQSERLWL